MALLQPIKPGRRRLWLVVHFVGEGAGGTAEMGSVVTLIFGASAAEPRWPSCRYDFLLSAILLLTGSARFPDRLLLYSTDFPSLLPGAATS
jgi:hypothetical protein